MRRLRTGGLTVIVVAVASLISAASASAAQIVVNSTADPTGATDECTLRQAIESANTDTVPVDSDCVQGGGTDTITFALPSAPPNTIHLADLVDDPDQLVVSSDLDIQGPGVHDVIVDASTGGGRSRVFHVTGTGVDATISGLTATGGHLNLPGPGFPQGQGGAGVIVDSGAALTLDDAAVAGNST